MPGRLAPSNNPRWSSICCKCPASAAQARQVGKDVSTDLEVWGHRGSLTGPGAQAPQVHGSSPKTNHDLITTNNEISPGAIRLLLSFDPHLHPRAEELQVPSARCSFTEGGSRRLQHPLHPALPLPVVSQRCPGMGQAFEPARCQYSFSHPQPVPFEGVTKHPFPAAKQAKTVPVPQQLSCCASLRSENSSLGGQWGNRRRDRWCGKASCSMEHTALPILRLSRPQVVAHQNCSCTEHVPGPSSSQVSGFEADKATWQKRGWQGTGWAPQL